ncbi:MAG: DUF3592 domain-containing protein [Anaerolineae bacterium]|nr:DUF3592 domain-containing protein [Thermoflexales bacterium]MDW8395383.1 DUF3592 domain-containing protein [Anaerolineae bacterium]
MFVDAGVLQFPLAMLLTTLGVSALGFGSVTLVRFWHFYSHAERTTATVVGSGKGRLFRFQTRNGEMVELPAMAGAERFAEGEVVSVLYSPSDPTDARLDRAFKWWLLPAALLVVGAALSAAGLSLLVGAIAAFN